MKPTSKDKSAPFLYWSGLILAALGAADSIYLTVLKYTQNARMCVGSHGCLTVNNSPYGSIHGIPVAVLGLIGYLFIGLALFLEPRWKLLREWGPVVVFGAALVGVLYSAYLTYLEFAVIHAFCPFCIASAIIITIVFILAIIRLAKQTSS